MQKCVTSNRKCFYYQPKSLGAHLKISERYASKKPKPDCVVEGNEMQKSKANVLLKYATTKFPKNALQISHGAEGASFGTDIERYFVVNTFQAF
jgi:hypothetical protein